MIVLFWKVIVFRISFHESWYFNKISVLKILSQGCILFLLFLLRGLEAVGWEIWSLENLVFKMLFGLLGEVHYVLLEDL